MMSIDGLSVYNRLLDEPLAAAEGALTRYSAASNALAATQDSGHALAIQAAQQRADEAEQRLLEALVVIRSLR